MKSVVSFAWVALAVLSINRAEAQVDDDLAPTVHSAAENTNAGSCLESVCWAPLWTVNAGAAILHRSKAREATLVEDGTTGTELANVGDFGLGWAVGPDFELTRHFQCGWAIGVRYFSVDGWNAERHLVDPGNLRVSLVSNDPGDYFDTASAHYASRLYSTEINVQREVGECLRLLAGYRYVELHEQVSADAWSPDLEGNFHFGTSNYLYGFQLGVEATLIDRSRLRVEGLLKTGVYGTHMGLNLAGQGTNFSANDSVAVGHTSFLGELGLKATYHLTEHWSIYGGYQLMWLEGVALAGDGVAAIYSADSEMIKTGAAFYHGALAGAEFRW